MCKDFPGFPKEPATNYWPYPKVLNGYWHKLTGSEQKVLDYILRHTWGFKKTADKISLTQFIKGVKNCDLGCGIKSRPTLVKALNGLVKKRFIKKLSTKYKTTEWQLNFLVKKLNQTSLETKPLTSLETKPTIKDNNKGYSIKGRNILKKTIQDLGLTRKYA
jgi:hypothetical protein